MILNLKKTVFFLLVLLSVTMSLTPILVDSIIIILAAAISVVILVLDKSSAKVFIKTYYPLIIFYSILILGLIYTNNLSKGFNQLEKKLTFIILPIVCFAIKDIINVKKIIHYFSFGVFFAAVICDVMLKVNHNVFFAFGYTTLLQPLDIDPTYFSMYIIFATTFFYNQLVFHKKKENILNTLAILYLLFFLLRVGSKIGIIVLFVVIIYLGFSFLQKRPKKTVFVILALIGLLFLVSFFTPLVYNRFYRPLFDHKFNFYQLRMSFFNERYYAWKCSLEAIKFKTIWFGYGTGDDKTVLKICYESYRRPYVLNSHNIYLSSVIKNGLFGLFSLILVLIQGFKTNKNLFILFSLIIIFTGLTESILERQKGIIFFTFICTLLLTELNQEKENVCVE